MAKVEVKGTWVRLNDYMFDSSELLSAEACPGRSGPGRLMTDPFELRHEGRVQLMFKNTKEAIITYDTLKEAREVVNKMWCAGE